MWTAPALSARSAPLSGARTLCLASAAALLLAACQTGAPQHPHANRQDTGLPLPAAALVLHAPELAGHSHASPAEPAHAPYPQSAATPDPVDPSPPGDDPDETPTPPIVPETQPHTIGLSPPPLDNPDAADLLDEWGHRAFARILGHRPLADPLADSDTEGLSAIFDAARSPDGSSPVPDLQEGDEIAVLGSRRGITYGRWIAGAADTLSMSFDLSNAGPEILWREGFLPLLERSGKIWTNRIDDTWEPWQLEPGHVKVRIPTQDGPETPIPVGPGGATSTGLEVHVTTLDLPGSTAGQAGPVNRWPTDRWEPHLGSLTIDTQHLDRAEEHELLSTLIHELGHVLGSWYGDSYTAPFAPYSDPQTGHWTGPNVVALHGGPAPFQDDDNPHASHDGQRDPAATSFDFAHSGICASVMSYCRYRTSAPSILPIPIDFAFLADLGLSIRPETDRPETYGLTGWMHHAGFAFSVSRDLRLNVAYPQHGTHGYFHSSSALEVMDFLHASATAFGQRSAGDILASYPATQRLGDVRYAGGLIGAAIDLPALPPVTGDANLSVDLDTLDGEASFTSLSVYSGGEPEPFAGGTLHYAIAIEDNAIAATDTDATLSAAFFGPAHEEIAGTLHDPGEGLAGSFGATHDDRPTPERILAEADHLTGLAVTRHPAGSSHNSQSQHRCTASTSCETRQFVAAGWSDWTPQTREEAVGATTPDPGGPAGKPHRDLGYLRIDSIPAPEDADEPQAPLDSAFLGVLTHGAFATGFDPLSSVWTGAYGTLSGSVPDSPAQWTGVMLGYSHAEKHAPNPFVQGRATLDLELARMELALAVSEIATVGSRHALPDFHFEGIELASDGTFHADNQGVLTGALLGPEREEAAATFHHDAADITGSFGAHAVPDTVSLEDAGTTTVRGTVTDATGTYDFHSYEDWGLWATQFDRELFRALVRQETTADGEETLYYPPDTTVFGTPSATNPVSGGAVWNGEARAFLDRRWTPATADARVAVDFAASTVDVDIADFDTDHPDLSWHDMRLFAGRFRHVAFNPTVQGSFYGTLHQGVAGTFRSDQLQGVFGAVRNDTGSFGDLGVPATVSLAETGEIERFGTATDELRTWNRHSFHDWGIWAEQSGQQLFRALIQQPVTVEGDTTWYETPRAAVFGTPSGTNPVAGGAVWNGEARAFHNRRWTAASAAARVAVDFAATTVDVDITDFDTDHPDMSWRDMAVSAGKFADAAIQPTIDGSFYGAAHQGVAGTFRGDRLRGVFGAVRNDDP